MNPGHIIIGLSGGVDSAVAALLLHSHGFQVRGLFMKNWEEDDTPGYCAAAADLKAAQTVAQHLGIELLTVNFAHEYWEQVFKNFLTEYQVGRTPNPDILCNSTIKFRAFLDYAITLGADYIATGHYAQIIATAHGPQLTLSADANKDQTYFLHRLTQSQLSSSMFPIGNITKQQVRAIAELAALPNATRKDSTGVCFIGERNFKNFLSHYLPPQPGPIETPEGQAIGQHQGLMYYTIGQRQGLGIGGKRGTIEAPWFVVAKDLTRNVLQVVPGREHPLLWNSALDAGNWHWINGQAPTMDIVYQARIRHRQPLQACRIHEIHSGCYRITFATPQWAIAPGQAVVIYAKSVCLGGGVIENSIRE